MNLDIGRAITYVRDDPNFLVKILIGGGLVFGGFFISAAISAIFSIVTGGGAFAAYSFGGTSAAVSSGVSLVAFFLNIISTIITSLVFIPIIGYGVQVVRNVITGQQPTLPEWSDFGLFFTDGAKMWVCSLALTAPAYIVLYGSRLPSAAAPTATGLGLVAGCGACLALPLFLLAGLLTPIVTGRYATTRDIAQTLNVSAILETLRANIGMYFMYVLVMFGLGLAGVFVSAFTCFIGLPFAFFFLSLVSAHLSGQAHVISQGGSMQPAYGSPYGNPPSGGGTPPYGGQRPF